MRDRLSPGKSWAAGARSRTNSTRSILPNRGLAPGGGSRLGPVLVGHSQAPPDREGVREDAGHRPHRDRAPEVPLDPHRQLCEPVEAETARDHQKLQIEGESLLDHRAGARLREPRACRTLIPVWVSRTSRSNNNRTSCWNPHEYRRLTSGYSTCESSGACFRAPCRRRRNEAR